MAAILFRGAAISRHTAIHMVFQGSSRVTIQNCEIVPINAQIQGLGTQAVHKAKNHN
jgi:hypothetical protein